MIWIVRVALQRPYTFIVLAMLILIIGPLAALQHAHRHLPGHQDPGDRAWSGPTAACRPTTCRGGSSTTTSAPLTSSVNDIEHIESQSLPGIGIVKIFFQPGVDIRTATAQVTSISQTVLKQMPPGITPPLILNYNASTVPILQLALSSRELVRAAAVRPRPELHPPGAGHRCRAPPSPTPYGGKERQIQVDLDPQALQSKGLSAQDVENAIAAQNQIIPAGTAKIGRFEYNVKLNDSPEHDRRAQRPADQDGERRDHLHARRGPRARRLAAAAQRSCAWMAAARC